MENKKEIKLEEELLGLVEEEFEAYVDQCDLDEDRCIDPEAFAKHAKEMIELEHGSEKFDDFNIKDYAVDFATGCENELMERAIMAAEAYYDEERGN